MENYTTNEQSLLSYLEEQHSTTKSQLTSENHTLWYWKSGNYINDMHGTQMSNHQIDFYITNCENRIKPLKFRLEWLDTQIGNIQSLISLTQPNK